MAMVTILKGLKHVFKDIGMSLSFGESIAWSAMFGILVAMLGSYLMSKVKRDLALEEKIALPMWNEYLLY